MRSTISTRHTPWLLKVAGFTLVSAAAQACWIAILAAWLPGDGTAAPWRALSSLVFGQTLAPGPYATATGLSVHLALTALAVTAGIGLARRTMLGQIARWKAGTVFGMASYAVVAALLAGQQWGPPFPDPDRLRVGLELVRYVALLGIPLFWWLKRTQPLS